MSKLPQDRYRRTQLFRSWQNMKARVSGCIAEQKQQYYRDKNIIHDPLWLSYDAFVADMGPTYTPGFALHRIDNNLGYFIDNCVWLPKPEHSALHSRLSAEKRRQVWGGYKGSLTRTHMRPRTTRGASSSVSSTLKQVD